MPIRNALAAGALSALLIAPPALAEVRGVVYELANPKAPRGEWQRKPLADAYVVLSWWIHVPGPGHATTSCWHNEIARSNDKGEYVIEGPGFLTSSLARGSVAAYAPGMERVDWPWAGTPEALREISMARSTRSADERLNFLLLFDDPGCYGEQISDPRGVLKAYREALAAEAGALQPATEAGRNVQRSLQARVKPPAGTIMRIEAVPADRRGLVRGATPEPR